MKKMIADFIQDEAGATAIEYGLIVALVGVGVISGMSLLGNNVSSSYDDLGTRVTSETTLFVEK